MGFLICDVCHRRPCAGSDCCAVCARSASPADIGAGPTNDALQRAIDSLDAVKVSPDHYAVKFADRYAIVTGVQIEGATIIGARAWRERVAGEYPEYVVWMRPWWTPEQRFAYAVRHIGAYDTHVFAQRYPLQTRDASSELDQGSYRQARGRVCAGEDLVIVTVDLETGREVPA